MSGALLIAGTCSDAGKSAVVTGVCRALRRRGIRVAPFKAQNMALNSAVTAAGEEIGRAQAAQAQACGIEPEAAMNPVLLKPSSERRSQVIVMGSPLGEVGARDYEAMKDSLRPRVLEALASLRERFDAVICEGAGGAAEINLRDGDLSNLGLARASGMPVLVVGDVDRGGVMAALHGTVSLLETDDQRLIAGFIVNKLRGDPGILDPGIERLGELTGRPTLGVLPWRSGLGMDAEDSLAIGRASEASLPPLGEDGIDVVAVRHRRLSNFTDLDALAAEPGVSVRFTRSATDVRRADLVVVPGTKATVEDLAALREDGLDRALARRAAAGGPVLGICGGYQMLGGHIQDDVESAAGWVQGLGLLPVETRFDPVKRLARLTGSATAFGGAAVQGFEIRHGRVERRGGAPLMSTEAGEEGCAEAAVLGTSVHGIAEGDDFRRALLGWVAGLRGLDFVPGERGFAELREARLDALGDLICGHLDFDAVCDLLERGAPAGIPTVSTSLLGQRSCLAATAGGPA